MGTATINSHLGGGLYSITVQFDNSKIESRIAYIDIRLAELATSISGLETEKTEKYNKYISDSNAMNYYISVNSPEIYLTNPAELNNLKKAVYESKSEYDLIVSELKREKLIKKQLEKEKALLQNNCPSTMVTTAWCVQKDETLSGSIKTIEIDYINERDTSTNQIRNDTGFWLPNENKTPDSKLQHIYSGSQHSVWYNLSMAPALQRDKGRYRVATLLDKVSGYIHFDGIYTTEEYTTRLSDKKPIFPIIGGIQREYYTGAQRWQGNCTDDLYVNGDRVIVDLQANGIGGIPKILGFYSNPRVCQTGGGGFTIYWPSFIDIESDGPFNYLSDVFFYSNKIIPDSGGGHFRDSGHQGEYNYYSYDFISHDLEIKLHETFWLDYSHQWPNPLLYSIASHPGSYKFSSLSSTPEVNYFLLDGDMLIGYGIWQGDTRGPVFETGSPPIPENVGLPPNYIDYDNILTLRYNNIANNIYRTDGIIRTLNGVYYRHYETETLTTWYQP